MRKIKIAIAGVGNCCASLIDGIQYYSHNGKNKSAETLGLMNYKIGNYAPSDIEVVAAFDIDKRKVGQRFDEALKANPNCILPLSESNGRYKSNVVVQMGTILDGYSDHMGSYPVDRTFVLANEKPADIEQVLKKSGAEILLNYLPVGSEQATQAYAQACLNLGISFINCMPVFIVSNPVWAKRFKDKGIPVVGDDVKAQIGATIVHRTLTKLFEDRGVKIDRTYQLNMGGNTDFLNMLNRERLISKKISKTQAVQSQLETPMPEENIHIGPSDYVPWLKDNKICYLRMEGRGFAGFPVTVELRLSVEDSPNSAGCGIDAIRCVKIARERKLGGPLTSISAYTMKHPPQQFSDTEARDLVRQFIEGKIKQ